MSGHDYEMWRHLRQLHMHARHAAEYGASADQLNSQVASALRGEFAPPIPEDVIPADVRDYRRWLATGYGRRPDPILDALDEAVRGIDELVP